MRSYNSAQTGQYGPADEVLLSEVRQGQLESFGVLYERYVVMARAIAYRHTSNQTLSEDLVSEAFVRILQALKNGKGPRAFMGGYLATTLAHLAAENGLIAQKEVLSEEHDLELAGSLDETVLKLHESDELISAFTSLPERWQSVLWMTEVENKKPREVAAALSLSANAVSALAARARESLREGFLRAHQHAPKTAECSQYSPHLSPMVRGSLTKKRSETLRAHLSTCAFCSSEYLNLIGINKTMRTWVFPVLAGLTPILTDSSKVFLPYIAGGSVAVAGASQSGGAGLASLVPGRWASSNPSLVGAAAVVTAIGAVVGGIALVNSSSSNSTVISADSQLEAAPASSASEEADGIVDALVDSSQSSTSSVPVESFRAPSASAPRMPVDTQTFDSGASQQGNLGENTSLSRAGAGNAADSSAGTSGGNAIRSSSLESAQSQAPSVLSGALQDNVIGAGGTSRNSADDASSLVFPNQQDDVAGAGDTNQPPVSESDTPVISTSPVDSQAPGESVTPDNPGDQVTPEDPADPTDPDTPVGRFMPADPADPVDPAEPVNPTDPGTPADPTDPAEPGDPVDPADPVDPGTPAEPEVPDPKDWVGTPEYYEWMAQVPWDTIGSPVNDNRMCTVTYTYSDSLVSFGTYIPPIILDSPYVFYVLESYFELEAITQITCV